MDVIAYRYDPKWIGALAALRRTLYAGNVEAERRTPELQRLLRADFPFHARAGNDHIGFVALRGDTAVGHVTAIVNGEMAGPDGNPIGTVGFFECMEDYDVADTLLGAAARWLKNDKGLARIWGPIQLDIWHGYRFKTRGFTVAPFTGEPSNKAYYPQYFEKFGFKPFLHWNSVWIADEEAAESFMARGDQERQHLIDEGFRFCSLENRAEFRGVHEALMKAFRQLPAFTALAYDEFERLFVARCTDLRIVTVVKNPTGDLSCFGLAYPNAHAGSKAVQDRESAVFYLIATVSADGAQERMLARSTVYHTIQRCHGAGYGPIVLALMRKLGWSEVPKFKHLDDALSEYALYDIEL